jgi:hypothetical protein
MAALTTLALPTEFSSAENTQEYLNPQVIKSLLIATDALVDPTVIDPSSAYYLS